MHSEQDSAADVSLPRHLANIALHSPMPGEAAVFKRPLQGALTLPSLALTPAGRRRAWRACIANGIRPEDLAYVVLADGRVVPVDLRREAQMSRIDQ